jgi:hypothetical protein
MPHVDRNEPIRADYYESSYSLMEFVWRRAKFETLLMRAASG